MAQNSIEKIAQHYAVRLAPGTTVHSGDYIFVRPKHVMTHDNTGAVISKFRAIGAQQVARPEQPVFTLDHNVQDRSAANLARYRAIAAFAQEQGISACYPAGAGIGHQLMLEEGFVTPGSLVVASDSHANIYGALAAVGTPVVRTDAAAIWASGETWWQVPPVVRVLLTGELPAEATGKDVIITLCGTFNKDEVLNCAIEFCGEGLSSLSIAERMTIANMSTEWGALAAFFPFDEQTRDYFLQQARRLSSVPCPRMRESDVRCFETDWFRPDTGARYAAEISLDLSTVSVRVTGPDGVREAIPLAEISKRQIRIHKAYLLSCVNARLEDLRAAAEVVRGKSVARGVEFYVAAASATVQSAAEAEGIWRAFTDAGAITLPPGCGPCIGLGLGTLKEGEIGISATNRNFKGRMGHPSAQAYLASPVVVAASALAGWITGPETAAAAAQLKTTYRRSVSAEPGPPTAVETIEGFPGRLQGRLLYLPADNMNTDGIYAGKWTYRDDLSAEEMAQKAFENYDPKFHSVAAPGDIIAGGKNFGCGSSREQAATCLKHAGIQLVIAGSFSQTYKRNAINNGFICIECPELLDYLRQTLPGPGAATVNTGRELTVNITASEILFDGERFRFQPLSTVPQELVAAGGMELWLNAELNRTENQ
jgi:homoaconitate hydratase